MTWCKETDYLRCTPSFSGQARYDHVLFNDNEGKIGFAQLVLTFLFEQEGQMIPIALIQQLDVPTAHRSKKDCHLGLHRLRERPRSQCDFIYLRSVVRGALITRDQDHDRDWFLVDAVDQDMFLRVKKMWPERRLELVTVCSSFLVRFLSPPVSDYSR